MNEQQKRWGAWVLVVLAVAVAGWLGVRYPMPEAPGEEIVALGMSHMSGLEVKGNETDELVVDQTSTGDIVEFRDNGTVVWRLADGGLQSFAGNCIDLDADDDTSICADTDDQIDFEIAGVDTIVMKAFPTSATVTATVNIVEVQGSSPAWTANTNEINALGIDLTVGNANTGTHTIRGVMIDAISADAQVTEKAIEIGTGWDTGIDMNALALTEVGAADFSSTASIAGLLTLQAGMTLSDGDAVIADDLRTTAQTALTVTNGAAFTPTGTYQNITAAGEVTPTITIATAGDLLVIINTSAQTINVADTGTAKLSAAWAGGQYDVLILWCDGTNWIEISRSDN